MILELRKTRLASSLVNLGEKNTDRGYTYEEIKKLLDVADLRMKSVVLLMASTGIRIGAIPDLQLKHLQKTNEKGLYKITVYERSKEEYHTFCSYEYYSVINAYLEFRKKSGEILNKESYLVREQFDINDFEQIRKKSRKISVATIKNSVIVLLRKAGLRELNQLRSISQI
jgi:integrase